MPKRFRRIWLKNDQERVPMNFNRLRAIVSLAREKDGATRLFRYEADRRVYKSGLETTLARSNLSILQEFDEAP